MPAFDNVLSILMRVLFDQTFKIVFEYEHFVNHPFTIMTRYLNLGSEIK